MRTNDRFKIISDALKRKYSIRFLTNNDQLHTVLFYETEEAQRWKLDNSVWDLAKDELPVLHCQLDAKNHFLMTTTKMLSLYLGRAYELKYADFESSDRTYYRFSKQIAEGKTRVFKYYSKKGDPFLYEIDSFYPADAAHNTILHYFTVKLKE